MRHPLSSSLAHGELIPFPAAPGAEPISFVDLIDHAELLAREFGFDREAALLGELEWYQERAGKEICSLSRANVLRSMVALRCREEEPIEAERRRRDNSVQVERQRRTTAITMALVLGSLLVICCLFRT